MRGLKPEEGERRVARHRVASFTDAWIETGGIGIRTGHPGRIFYRCVD